MGPATPHSHNEAADHCHQLFKSEMKIIFLKHKLTPFPFSPTCPTFSSTSLATRSSTKITAKSPNYQMPSSSSPLALAVWVGILLIILITSIVTGEDLNDQADQANEQFKLEITSSCLSISPAQGVRRMGMMPIMFLSTYSYMKVLKLL